jgi:hypothetical protein
MHFSFSILFVYLVHRHARACYFFLPWAGRLKFNFLSKHLLIKVLTPKIYYSFCFIKASTRKNRADSTICPYPLKRIRGGGFGLSPWSRTSLCRVPLPTHQRRWPSPPSCGTLPPGGGRGGAFPDVSSFFIFLVFLDLDFLSVRSVLVFLDALVLFVFLDQMLIIWIKCSMLSGWSEGVLPDASTRFEPMHRADFFFIPETSKVPPAGCWLGNLDIYDIFPTDT